MFAGACACVFACAKLCTINAQQKFQNQTKFRLSLPVCVPHLLPVIYIFLSINSSQLPDSWQQDEVVRQSRTEAAGSVGKVFGQHCGWQKHSTSKAEQGRAGQSWAELCRAEKRRKEKRREAAQSAAGENSLFYF